MRRIMRQRAQAGLAAVGLWSTNALTAQYVLARTSVAWLLLVEAASASLALGVVRVLGHRPPPRPPPRPGRHGRAVVVSVVGLAGTMTLQYLAYATAPIVAANALTYTWPLAAAAWFALRLRDRRAVLRGALAATGFAGVVLTIGGAHEGGAGGAHPVLGLACALGSAACMALFTLGSDDGGATRVLPLGTGAAAAIGACWVVATHPAPPTAGVWVVAAFMGVGQMAIGYRLWGHAMSGGGARRLAGLGYATPLLSTLLLLLTGSPVTAPLLVGIGVILASSIGVLAANTAEPAASCAGQSTVDLTGDRAGRSP